MDIYIYTHTFIYTYKKINLQTLNTQTLSMPDDKFNKCKNSGNPNPYQNIEHIQQSREFHHNLFW